MPYVHQLITYSIVLRKPQLQSLLLIHSIHCSDRRGEDSTWKTTIDRELSKYNIDLDPKETSKSVWKKHIKDKVKNQNTKEVTENCKEKQKQDS